MKKGYTTTNKREIYSGLDCKYIVTRTIETPNNLIFNTINAVNSRGSSYAFRITSILTQDGDLLFKENESTAYHEVPEINKIPDFFSNHTGLLSKDNATVFRNYTELISDIYSLDEKIAAYLDKEKRNKYNSNEEQIIRNEKSDEEDYER